jgi:hypothetical protein
MASVIPRLISRYYCEEDKGARCYPHDSILMENGAIAPEPGRKGQAILLASLNGREAGADHKWAYCFVGKHWTFAKRITQHEMATMYAGLGVEYRFVNLNGSKAKGKTARRERMIDIIERRLKKHAKQPGKTKTKARRKAAAAA